MICLYNINTGSSPSTAIVAGAGAAAGLLLLCILLVVILHRRKNRKLGASEYHSSANQTNQQNIIVAPRSIHDLDFGNEIGHGEFGVVSMATVRSSGAKVAVKMLKSSSEAAQESFRKEANQLAVLNHENVVRLLGTQIQSTPYMIVLEYMPNGDLKNYLTSAGSELRLAHQVSLSRDVSAVFAYLQSKKFVHRDLAARNVLLDSRFTAKISDFGMARQLFATEYYRQGSAAGATGWTLPLRWMAPESYSDGTWDLRTDVWMFGVLLWEIFSQGELPWKGLADSHVIQNIQRRAKLDQPANCPNEFYYDIMLSCWRLDPFARISGSDVVTSVRQYVRENDLDLDELTWPAVGAVTGQDVDMLVDFNSVDAVAKIESMKVSGGSIEIGSLLGEGAFGAVSKGIMTKEGRSVNVAVKTIKGDSSAEMRRKFADEARLFALLQHPSIVACVGVHLTSEPLMIVLELMQGDLKSYFKRTVSVSTAQLVGVTLQIARAMEYLSSKRIVHRDLAARNVLVGTDGLRTVKLNDFGLSRTLSTSDYYKKVSSDKIPVRWMAPESIVDRKYSSASDAWSFGVFCWEVFEHGKTPYPGISLDALLGFLLRGSRLNKPELCPGALYDLMLQCWQVDAKARPAFTAIVYRLNGIEDEETEEESRL